MMSDSNFRREESCGSNFTRTLASYTLFSFLLDDCIAFYHNYFGICGKLFNTTLLDDTFNTTLLRNGNLSRQYIRMLLLERSLFFFVSHRGFIMP